MWTVIDDAYLLRSVACEVLQWACLSVCLSVCLSLRSHISKTTRSNFTTFVRTCYPGAPSTSDNNLMYFRFCGWRHICPQWAMRRAADAAYVQWLTRGQHGRRSHDVYDCLATVLCNRTVKSASHCATEWQIIELCFLAHEITTIWC